MLRINSVTKTEKPVVSTSKRLATSSDDEEHGDTEAAPKSVAKNTRLTPKLNRLRPRTVGVGTKQLAGNSHKSSTSSSFDGKKRKQDEEDDDNMKQIPKEKKKQDMQQKNIRHIKIFFLY
jgi:hypothetical protein